MTIVEPVNYGVYCGDNAYFLMVDGNVIRQRMRQFKRAWWRTQEGARRAADKLNAAAELHAQAVAEVADKLADATAPRSTMYDVNNPPENGSGG